MDDKIDELLGEDKSKVEPETPKEEGEAKVYEVNGKKYTKDEVDKMAADFQASEKERGRLAQEVGTLRKETAPAKPETPADEGLPESERPRVKKVFKEQLGFVTAEDLDNRDYVRDATKEVQRISKEYEFSNTDDLFKEMIDMNRRVPVEKLELLFKLTHPDVYEKKRAAAIAAEKPATPYTERTTKQGVEIQSPGNASFRKGNTVNRAMELIGAKE